MIESQAEGSDKMACLEAIRGLASLAVLVGHFVLSFWPAVYYCSGDGWDKTPLWIQWFAYFVGRFFWDGERAVVIFFVLSGFVLSLAFFQKGSVSALGSAAARRYPRLMLPAAASVLLAYILLQIGMIHCQEAAQLMSRSSGYSYVALQAFYNFPADFSAALREGVWGAFTTGSSYNHVLWTMTVELPGSFLVYGFLAMFGGLRNRWILYSACGALLMAYRQFHFLEFLAGMALCDLWVYNQRTWRISLATAPALVLIVVALFLVRSRCLTALLIIAAAAASPGVQAMLSTRWLACLGRLSFSLYLVHMPVFCSLGCGLYLLLCRELGWQHYTGAGAAALTSAVVSFLVAWLFYHTVDRPTIALARKLDGWLFRRHHQLRRLDAVQPVLTLGKAA